MKPARKAGPTKSWVCIVALTFLLPAAASQLTNVLILGATHTAHQRPTAYEGRIATVEAQSADCEAGAVETTL